MISSPFLSIQAVKAHPLFCGCCFHVYLGFTISVFKSTQLFQFRWFITNKHIDTVPKNGSIFLWSFVKRAADVDYECQKRERRHTIHSVSPVRITTIKMLPNYTFFIALQKVIQLVLTYTFICGISLTSITFQLSRTLNIKISDCPWRQRSSITTLTPPQLSLCSCRRLSPSLIIARETRRGNTHKSLLEN